MSDEGPIFRSACFFYVIATAAFSALISDVSYCVVCIFAITMAANLAFQISIYIYYTIDNISKIRTSIYVR